MTTKNIIKRSPQRTASKVVKKVVVKKGSKKIDPRDLSAIADSQAAYLARFNFLGREDITRLRKAYMLSEVGHRGQVRDSGHDYFTHPRTVSLLLLSVGIKDVDVHIAALCHDLVEDTVITPEQIKFQFGARVAQMVETVSIPTKSNGSFVTQDKYERYFAQLGKGKPDAQLVALGDNLHNIQTLKYCSHEKQKRVRMRAETFYIPLIDAVAKTYPEIKKFKALYKEALAK